jgi:hypothetical protein
MVSLDDAKAELQARANGKQQRVAPETKPQASGGYSKEYLQKAADPNRFGRYMISVEKAQELLNNMQEGVAEGYDTAEDYRAKAQWLRSELHLSPDEAWERAYDTDPETWVGSPWEDDYKQGMAEGNETTPFGSVNDQRPQMPAVPQQDREAQEQARERQARISDFREKKRDLLQQFAQLGTLRTEMIHGLDNDVFLNKDQLIDFFKQQIDDPSLTALEYAYENDIPTDGLIKNILRRATQLGISMLDVRKMFNQAKQKLGENIGRKVDAKGRTQHEWMQLVKQKFPDAKIVQAKMIDGPAHAMLPDGRKFSWTPVQGVAEVGQNFRRGNAQRAALNAMSPEERKAYEEKRAEQQRKRDEARLERERQRNAAKKGVAEAPGAETLAHNQSTVASNEKAFDLEEGKPREKEADYGADYQDMVARVKKLAGLGPLKTVYDPQKRVYKNVPRAEQPKK